MKKFHFRFEQILRHKKRMEELLEESLAKKEHAVREALHEVTLAESQVKDMKARMVAMQSGNLRLDEWVVAADYLARLRELLASKREQLSEAEASRDAERHLLNEAMKERKMFEKLREKEFNKWLQMENQWEQRLLDEIAQRRRAMLERHGGGV